MSLKLSDTAAAVPSVEIPQCSKSPTELTAREREVAILTAKGMQCAQIGQALGIETKTVKVYRTSIFKKIGHRGIAHVTRYAIRQGWIEP